MRTLLLTIQLEDTEDGDHEEWSLDIQVPATCSDLSLSEIAQLAQDGAKSFLVAAGFKCSGYTH